jgi:hypothetical protein
MKRVPPLLIRGGFFSPTSLETNRVFAEPWRQISAYCLGLGKELLAMLFLATRCPRCIELLRTYCTLALVVIVLVSSPQLQAQSGVKIGVIGDQALSYDLDSSYKILTEDMDITSKWWYISITNIRNTDIG